MSNLKDYLYYQDKWTTIYCGDCLEIMPMFEEKFDLIATDPPYGLNYNDGDLAHQREKVFGGKIERMEARPIAKDGEEEACETFQQFLRIAKQKLLKGGACCCCCCCGGGGPKPLFARWTLWMDEIIGFKQAVIWDKMGLGMGIHYRRNYEFVLIAQNGNPSHRWNGGNDTPNVWRISKIIPSEKQHPTEKPVELFNKIITIHSNVGDLILDPFMGHGSCLEAAKNLNRKAIGIEIEPEYCETVVKRLRQEVFDFGKTNARL